MRNDFVKQLHDEMEKNENIVFITGDLGFNALESLQEKFKDRFINAGIAEGNMIGVASGLALVGKRVIAYSIASFATMRCYEQIRTDVCYHNLDVKIVGTGGGYNYATHGVTHHTIEDTAIMNVLPNMTVLQPTHSWEAREATKAMLKHTGPVYLKLGKAPTENFAKPDWKFQIGKGFVIQEGKEIALITTGNILDTTIQVAEMLEKKLGIRPAVISIPTIKPLDDELILNLAKKNRAIFTIEEHSTIGGLGSVVANLLMRKGQTKNVFHPFGVEDVFIKDVGDREYLLKKAGLDPETISKKIFNLI